jgi:hypothetical protein
VPEDMPASRYRVGEYEPNEGWHGPKASQSKQSLSHPAHLYRVLKPVQHKPDFEPEHAGLIENGRPLSQSQPISSQSDSACMAHPHIQRFVSPSASTRAGDSPPSPRSQAASECDSDEHHRGMAWRSPEELAASWYPDHALPSSTSVTLSPGRPRARLPSGRRRPSSAGAIRPSSAGAIRPSSAGALRKQAEESRFARSRSGSVDAHSRK